MKVLTSPPRKVSRSFGRRAAAGGDAPYIDTARENRDKIAKLTTAQQIAEAQAMAQKCEASHYKQWNYKQCD
jgi:hypothetical protein